MSLTCWRLRVLDTLCVIVPTPPKAVRRYRPCTQIRREGSGYLREMRHVCFTRHTRGSAQSPPPES